MRFRSKRDGIYRSGVERFVADDLNTRGIPFRYEDEKLPYTFHRTYTPDFSIGDLHFEVKGWWPSDERAKLLNVIRCNPKAKIIVALENPHMTISKKSKTTYAMWCKKHGIPWCRIPLPEDLIQSWLAGEQLTSHVQDPTATVPMEPQLTQMDLSTALFANSDTSGTDRPGGEVKP